MDEYEESTATHAEHKTEGNGSYKKGDYRQAIYHYTLAIESASPLLPNPDPQQPPQPQSAAADQTDPETQSSHSSSSSESSSPLQPPVTKQLLASYYSNRAAASTMILRYEDAMFDCDRAVDLDPTLVKARVRKAKVLTSLGRWKEASQAYGRALVYDPNDAAMVGAAEEVKRLERRFDLLAMLLDGGKKEKVQVYPYMEMPPLKESKQALNQINLVLVSSPESVQLLLYKVRALVYLHNVQEAYALSTSLMRRSTESSSSAAQHGSAASTKGEREQLLLLYRAHCLYCMGNLDDAVKHARQILSGDPDSKPAFAMHRLFKTLGKKKAEADAAYKSHRFDDSVKLYTEALGLAPGGANRGGGLYRAKLFFNRASANANLRDHRAVVADCTDALRCDSDYLKAYTRRAASKLLVASSEGDDDLVDAETAQRRGREALQDYERAMELSAPGGSLANEAVHADVKKKIQAAQVQIKRMGKKDLYKTLEVGRDATDAEVKKCYRKKALKWHPDRHASSTEEEKARAEKIFRDVNLAYEVLSDPEKKKKYDCGVDVEDMDNPNAGAHGGHHFGGGGGMPGGIDPQVLFQMFMQQQGGGFH